MFNSIRRFLDELLLASGQYTLFYIILALSTGRHELFANRGIFILVIMLILQTFLLMRFGNKSIFRFLFSAICPLTFTLIQISNGGFAILNMNLLFFWISQFYFAFIKSCCKHTKSPGSKKIFEFLISMGTIAVFLFLAFYYNLMLSFGVKDASGLLSGAQSSDFFSIVNLPTLFRNFLVSPTHKFIIGSSLIIGLILALTRIRIISLKYRIMELFQIEDTKSENFPRVQIPETHTDQQFVAILHADIRNFSQLAEKYSSEAIIESLNLYFSTWGNIAQKYGGVIDKYMGDAIVILFPPTPSPDDDIANRSVTCALNFLDQLQNFQEEFAIRNLPIVQNIGIGISCGDIILAELGSPDKKMKTAIGHPLSIASRMQSLCREFHQDIVIDQNIYKKLSLENQALFLLLGEVLVRGKTTPMPVYGRK